MNLQQQLGEWYPLLSHVFDTEWMQKLGRRIGACKTVQPQLHNLFRAFSLCPPDKVKVVIIGQDPYINGEADGLAFSSFGKPTPSLEVIFEELNRTGWTRRTQTHLDDWAVQGVFLLNSVLTTEMGKSKAHAGWGWELFTQEILGIIWDLQQPVVGITWGKDAKNVLYNGTAGKNQQRNSRLILSTCHPQAQNWNPANKFVGCNHFYQANVFLLKAGIKPIWWTNPLSDDMKEEWSNYLQHLKIASHAEVNITPFLYSYPAVPDFPHPFDDGLESRYKEDLPF